MLVVGLLGGVAWPSTVEYYIEINKQVHKRVGQLHSSRIVVYSLDLNDYVQFLHEENTSAVENLLLDGARRVRNGGADFLVICSNTAHLVVDVLAKHLPDFPVLHIADTLAIEIKNHGISKVGFVGTKFAMRHTSSVIRRLKEHGIEPITPSDEKDIEKIEHIIENELSHNIINVESKKFFLEIFEKIRHEIDEIGGFVLGCTEIPLLVKQADYSLPLFDTTTLHIAGAVEVQLQSKTVSDFLPTPKK